MKLKYDFEIMELDDEIMAIPIGENSDDFKGVIKLNVAAADIFRLLMTETNIDDLVKNLMEKYDTPENKIKDYVVKYIDQLSNNGLLKK